MMLLRSSATVHGGIKQHTCEVGTVGKLQLRAAQAAGLLSLALHLSGRKSDGSAPVFPPAQLLA
jgi:hypothetical protein